MIVLVSVVVVKMIDLNTKRYYDILNDRKKYH